MSNVRQSASLLASANQVWKLISAAENRLLTDRAALALVDDPPRGLWYFWVSGFQDLHHDNKLAQTIARGNPGEIRTIRVHSLELPFHFWFVS